MTLVATKIVHIHPTRLCNLNCAHCYSSSGPQQKEYVPADLILDITKDLRSLGYDRVSLSGGEPSIYPEIETLCVGLKQQGFPVSLVTNGWKIDRLIPLIDNGSIDEIFFSFDGLAKGHDGIRGRTGVFDRALSSIALLKSMSASIGALVSVSKKSLVNIPQLVELLAKQKVETIQFHPLSNSGRAIENSVSLIELSEHELLSLLMLARIFECQYQNIHFHCDAIAKHQLPSLLTPNEGDLISPLVIKENGKILPISYDMPHAFGLGDIKSGFKKPLLDDSHVDLFEQTLSLCSTKHATSFYNELIAVATQIGYSCQLLTRDVQV